MEDKSEEDNSDSSERLNAYIAQTPDEDPRKEKEEKDSED